jgi:predicted metal-binding protein
VNWCSSLEAYAFSMTVGLNIFVNSMLQENRRTMLAGHCPMLCPVCYKKKMEKREADKFDDVFFRYPKASVFQCGGCLSIKVLAIRCTLREHTRAQGCHISVKTRLSLEVRSAFLYRRLLGRP